MGSTIPEAETIAFTVDVVDLDGEDVTLELFDRWIVVASTTLTGAVAHTWTVAVPGTAGHFYFVRATQADGDVAYTSPIWTSGWRRRTWSCSTSSSRPASPRRGLGRRRHGGSQRRVGRALQPRPHGRRVSGLATGPRRPRRQRPLHYPCRNSHPAGGLPRLLQAGKREIKAKRPGGIQHLRQGQPVAPLPIATGEVGEATEGLLVQVTGKTWSAMAARPFAQTTAAEKAGFTSRKRRASRNPGWKRAKSQGWWASSANRRRKRALRGRVSPPPALPERLHPLAVEAAGDCRQPIGPTRRPGLAADGSQLLAVAMRGDWRWD